MRFEILGDLKVFTKLSSSKSPNERAWLATRLDGYLKLQKFTDLNLIKEGQHASTEELRLAIRNEVFLSIKFYEFY